jgi:hypothetical protein
MNEIRAVFFPAELEEPIYRELMDLHDASQRGLVGYGEEKW